MPLIYQRIFNVGQYLLFDTIYTLLYKGLIPHNTTHYNLSSFFAVFTVLLALSTHTPKVAKTEITFLICQESFPFYLYACV